MTDDRARDFARCLVTVENLLRTGDLDSRGYVKAVRAMRSQIREWGLEEPSEFVRVHLLVERGKLREAATILSRMIRDLDTGAPDSSSL